MAIGGTLGVLIIAALPGAYWHIVFDVPKGAEPPQDAALAVRLRDGRSAAVESEKAAEARRDLKLVVARSILFLLAIAVLMLLA